MAALSTAAPLELLTPPPSLAMSGVMSASESGKRAAIHKTATDFEASFLNAMLEPMFEGVSVDEPFGGGAGEAAFKSFMTEAFAKQMAARGGVGVAASVQHEMLRLQGLK